MLDEMVKLIPEGVYLKSAHQDGRKVTMVGLAQSNERVSELLRNFANKSQWVERPNLIEIKLGPQGLNLRGPRLYEFSIDVLLKRPSSVKDTATAPTVTTGAAK
jgi:type IV pilus assembly protein PilN